MPFRLELDLVAYVYRTSSVPAGEVAITTLDALQYVGAGTTVAGTATGLDGETVAVTINGEAFGDATIIGGVWSVTAAPTEEMAGATLGEAVDVVAIVGSVSDTQTTDVYWYAQETGLVGLFDGLDNTVFTLSGSDIDVWADKSAAGNDLVASGATKLTRTGAINGFDAVSGTGGTAGALVVTADWVEVQVVALYGAATFATRAGLISGGTVLGADDAALNGAVGMSTWDAGASGTPYLDGAASSNAPMVTAGVAGFVSTGSPDQIRVGDDRGLARQWGGQIGDAVFFSAELASAARARVVACAKARYGIT